MTRFASLFLALSLALPTAAAAQGFEPIRDKGIFLANVAQKDLRLPLWGVALRVQPNGSIQGKALGKPITGKWEWRNGQFCREMAWGDQAIAHNCQLVEIDATARNVRFTVDNGAGDSAVFKVR